MTVVDTSAVVDFLVDGPAAGVVEELMSGEGELSAPELLVFEVVAVLRREVSRGGISEARAAGAVDDLGDVPVQLFATLPLRRRAWELRKNFTVADALFVALAETLREPLATKDSALARAATAHAGIEVLELPPRGRATG